MRVRNSIMVLLTSGILCSNGQTFDFLTQCVFVFEEKGLNENWGGKLPILADIVGFV